MQEKILCSNKFSMRNKTPDERYTIQHILEMQIKKEVHKTLESVSMDNRWKTTAMWAVSSGGEHCLDTAGVTSSNLVSPTIEYHKTVKHNASRFFSKKEEPLRSSGNVSGVEGGI